MSEMIEALDALFVADGMDPDEVLYRRMSLAVMRTLDVLAWLDGGSSERAEYVNTLAGLHPDGPAQMRAAQMLLTAAGWVHDLVNDDSQPPDSRSGAQSREPERLRDVPRLRTDVQVANPVLPEQIRGLDGKTYPAARLPVEQRAQLAGLVHRLYHEGSSMRGIVATLAADGEGVRRSVGWVAGVLREWRCEQCSGWANPAPEQSASDGAS